MAGNLSVRVLVAGMLLASWGVGAGADRLLADDVAESATQEVTLEAITLKVPKTWKQQPPANRLRLGQFEVPGPAEDSPVAELSVFSFGASEVDANVRRWIDSFQPQGRKAQAVAGTSTLGKYYLVDVQGTYNQPVGPPVLRKTQPAPDNRMLAVMLLVKDKGAYFLKLVGEQATVASASNAFRASFGGAAANETEYKLPE
jgi:hypothetical protein